MTRGFIQTGKGLLVSLFLQFPLIAFALGLGEIQVHSYLNDPLNAQIPLLSIDNVDLNTVIISVGDPETYEKAGLELPTWVNQINFEIANKDSKHPILKLTTQAPIKDPYVDLLIVVSWPGDKLIREYTLLLDPPKTSGNLSYKKPARILSLEEKVTSSLEKPIETTRQYGPVYNETLWSVAKKMVDNSSHSVHQGMLAIAKKNPEAFKGNINALKEGITLEIPSEEELNNYSFQEAEQFVHSENESWKHPMPEKTEVAKADLTVEKSDKDENNFKPLKLVSPATVTTTPTNLGGEGHNSTGNSLSNFIAQRLSLVEEAVDTLKRSNDEIAQRNSVLQSQNDSLASLLAAKENELQQLKTMINKTQKGELSASLPSYSTPSSSKPIGLLLLGAALIFVFYFAKDKLNKFSQKLAFVIKSKFRANREIIKVEEEKTDQIETENVEIDVNQIANVENSLNQEIEVNDSKLSEALPEDTFHDDKNVLLLEEAKNYINYERYLKAEKVLHQILDNDPQQYSAFLTLLELYVLTEKYHDFELLLETMPKGIENELQIWNKIGQLKQKVENEKIIFTSLKLTPKIKINNEEENKVDLPPKEESIVSIPALEPVPTKISSKVAGESSSTLSLEKIESSPSPITETPTAEVKTSLQSQLALAQAFINIGDNEAARELLVEVLTSGSLAEKQQVQLLLDHIDKP